MLTALGMLEVNLYRYQEATVRLTSALDLFTALGEAHGYALASPLLGFHLDRGDLDAATVPKRRRRGRRRR